MTLTGAAAVPLEDERDVAAGSLLRLVDEPPGRRHEPRLGRFRRGRPPGTVIAVGSARRADRTRSRRGRPDLELAVRRRERAGHANGRPLAEARDPGRQADDQATGRVADGQQARRAEATGYGCHDARRYDIVGTDRRSSGRLQESSWPRLALGLRSLWAPGVGDGPGLGGAVGLGVAVGAVASSSPGESALASGLRSGRVGVGVGGRRRLEDDEVVRERHMDPVADRSSARAVVLSERPGDDQPDAGLDRSARDRVGRDDCSERTRSVIDRHAQPVGKHIGGRRDAAGGDDTQPFLDLAGITGRHRHRCRKVGRRRSPRCRAPRRG